MNDSFSDTSVQQYLHQFEQALPRYLPQREELLQEIASHIAEGIRRHEAVEQVLAELGPPEELAEQYAAELKYEHEAIRRRIVLTVVPSLIILAGYILVQPKIDLEPFRLDYVIIRWVSCISLAAGTLYLFAQRQHSQAVLWTVYALGFSFLTGGVASLPIDLAVHALLPVLSLHATTALPYPLFISVFALLIWLIIVSFITLKRPGKTILTREYLPYSVWVILPAAFFLVWMLLEISGTAVNSYLVWFMSISLLLAHLDVMHSERSWRTVSMIAALQVGIGSILACVALSRYFGIAANNQFFTPPVSIIKIILLGTPMFLLVVWRGGATFYALLKPYFSKYSGNEFPPIFPKNVK
ncbi:HAAS signaling domain-containing protein [Kallotenue papyrolyticum]|uniref:HAAS signaling domain-containing protein n=1 Tax=Kallotenue papyrolyticum TaxID=1325125 RepID=UPI0012695933|nr:hypothetical protein [Kallotenue papyrolyticum]